MDKRGGGGVSRISGENFSSHSTEKIRRGTLRCFRKFRVWTKNMDKRRVSRFSVGNSLSHSTEKLHGGIFLCFRKFLISKNFMDNRGVSRFSGGIFLSHSAKKFRTGMLRCFREPRVSKSLTHKEGRGGGVTILCRKIFCLILPKNFVGDPSLFDKISVIEKFLHEGDITIFSLGGG